jgi:hypothetical protein
VPTALTPDWAAIEARLVKEAPSLSLEKGLGAASVVGDLPESALVASLDAIGAPPLGATANGQRISLLVSEERLDDAVRALHAKLIG